MSNIITADVITGIGLQGLLPFVIIGIKLDHFDGIPRDGVTLLPCITPFDTSRENDKRS